MQSIVCAACQQLSAAAENQLRREVAIVDMFHFLHDTSGPIGPWYCNFTLLFCSDALGINRRPTDKVQHTKKALNDMPIE